MSKRWNIKPGKSLRENARQVVPAMVDDFLSHKDRVIEHPRLKHDLHRMRLAGKTLRYALEIFEPGFQEEFSQCLEAVKGLLDTMGAVHDCDVNIPRLKAFLREIRLFNKLRSDGEDRVRTTALIRVILEQSALRRSLFAEMTSMLQRWERDNFRDMLLRSMLSPISIKE